MKKVIQVNCDCDCHIQPKDHKGFGCCDLVNEIASPLPKQEGLEPTQLLGFKNKKEILRLLDSIPEGYVCLLGYVDEKGDIVRFTKKDYITYAHQQGYAEGKRQLIRGMEKLKIFTIHRGTLLGRVDEEWVKKSDVLKLIDTLTKETDK